MELCFLFVFEGFEVVDFEEEGDGGGDVAGGTSESFDLDGFQGVESDCCFLDWFGGGGGWEELIFLLVFSVLLDLFLLVF